VQLSGQVSCRSPRPAKLLNGSCPTPSAGRKKGHIRHEEHGLRLCLLPSSFRGTVARRSALRHLVETFFDGFHRKRVVAALLGGEVFEGFSSEELERLAQMISKNRKES